MGREKKLTFSGLLILFVKEFVDIEFGGAKALIRSHSVVVKYAEDDLQRSV